MKAILTTVLVCAFLQVVWVSLSTGQTDCGKLANLEECCNTSCVYVNCTDKEGKVLAGCYNDTTGANCSNPDEAVDICPKAPEDPCHTFNNSQTDCCGAQNLSCEFYNCNSVPANSTVCVQVNATDICPIGTTPSTDQCKTTTSTATPTTTATLITCEAKKLEADCCAIACSFYNCTDTSGTVTPVCTNSTSTSDICPNGTTQSGELCKGGTTPTHSTSIPTPPASTESPSKGGDQGQHFDGASFVGGIVLCAGLVAIAYFGLKFYRSRQDRNYHTL